MRRTVLVTTIVCACSAEEPEAGADESSSRATAYDSGSERGDATAPGETTTAALDSDTSIDAASNVDSSGDASSSSETGEPIDPAWQAFLDRREDDLLALMVPIAACVANVDTNHAAFHGCIDWHSAVHGTYSLLAIHRLTGDAESLAIAEATLEPNAVAGELVDLQNGGIPGEIPYGYSWFLALARERECATGATDLEPLADEVAAQLSAWLAMRTQGELDAGILADDYANLSWAALNLWQWGQHSGDVALVTEMETFVTERLLDPAYDDACPLTNEQTDVDDFFPPCLHRLRAITTVLPPSEFDPWLTSYLPADFELVPIGMPPADHIAGLNFARAWGLFAAHEASGDPPWRDLYVDHVVTHVEQPEYWAENYGAYAHWVAQFGVYAIALTYDDCD